MQKKTAGLQVESIWLTSELIAVERTEAMKENSLNAFKLFI